MGIGRTGGRLGLENFKDLVGADQSFFAGKVN
jgi:hypothetical protein